MGTKFILHNDILLFEEKKHLRLGRRIPANKKIRSITNMPNELATTIVFKIAPSNRNKAKAIWCVKKNARSWAKNLKSVQRGTCHMQNWYKFHFVGYYIMITNTSFCCFVLSFILFCFGGSCWVSSLAYTSFLGRKKRFFCCCANI